MPAGARRERGRRDRPAAGAAERGRTPGAYQPGGPAAPGSPAAPLREYRSPLPPRLPALPRRRAGWRCGFGRCRSAKPVPRRGKGAPPILVVGTTRDPATPFRWAKALAHDLTSGVLLGWNGDGHTAYMVHSSCIDSAVDKYLI